MNLKNDITGQTFGRLTAVKDVGKDKQRNRLWLCNCTCGGTVSTTASRLKNGTCQSCGCILTENKKKCGHSRTHGKSGTSEYNIWNSMKQRMLNSKQSSYHSYGGRGLDLDPAWYKFENFYTDMGKRPSLKHSLDRINNNLGYGKENCRWATQTEQMNNTRNNRSIKYKGETKTVAQWAKQLSINYSTLTRRLNNGTYSINQAMEESLQKTEHLLTHKNKTQNIRAWAKELNIPATTISGRLQMGWTGTRALSTPVKRAKLKGVTAHTSKFGINYQVRIAKNNKRTTLYSGKDYFEACCTMLSYRNKIK